VGSRRTSRRSQRLTRARARTRRRTAGCRLKRSGFSHPVAGSETQNRGRRGRGARGSGHRADPVDDRLADSQRSGPPLFARCVARGRARLARPRLLHSVSALSVVELPPTEDQRPFGALGPDGLDDSTGLGVWRWEPGWESRIPWPFRPEDLVEGSDELGVASWLRARSRRSGGAASVSSKSVWTMKESPAMTPWGCAGGTRLGRSVPPGPGTCVASHGSRESVRRPGHSAPLATTRVSAG
jgi:hypothetical protein